MPLSEASPRTHRHTRRITVYGYEREDGLFDIEAELTDTKTYGFDTIDRPVLAGTPLHRMLARLTVNVDMEIVHAEAVTEFGPYNICGGGAESFGLLAGLTIKPGFLRAANERLGGIKGCTHLRELLQQIATTAFQTLFPAREKREAERGTEPSPRILNSCHAYDASGPVVARRWPEFYTGPRPEQTTGRDQM